MVGSVSADIDFSTLLDWLEFLIGKMKGRGYLIPLPSSHPSGFTLGPKLPYQCIESPRHGEEGQVHSPTCETSRSMRDPIGCVIWNDLYKCIALF
jgi:hypothetical protein